MMDRISEEEERLCPAVQTERWFREVDGVHGIKGCLDPEFKNWGGRGGLCWWKKQNERSLGGMENLERV